MIDTGQAPAVMGGDISLRKTGICLPDGYTLTITTGEAKLGDWRLYDLQRSFRYTLRANPCTLAVLEDLPRHSKGEVSIIGMAHGVIRSTLAEYRIPRALITPAGLKVFATGAGNSDKASMILAANAHRAYLQPGSRQITDDNEADAWWLQQMGQWFHGARHLAENADPFLHGDKVRQRCVFGPWKDPKNPGAKWPGR